MSAIGSDIEAIDAVLYQHIVTENCESFKENILSRKFDVLKLRHAREKNNVLHIAATFGHVRLVEDVLSHWPGLMIQGNSQGNLPVYSAFEGGRLECVEAMVSWLEDKDDEMIERVLGCNTNRKKNTLLHIGLELLYGFDHYATIMMVRKLVELYPRACYAMNKEGICPLYLAINHGLVDIVREMLEKLHPFKQGGGVLGCLRKRKSVLHAAVSTNNTEILEDMLGFDGEELIKSTDKQGLTPLSYAAYNGYFKQVRILVTTLPHSAFISNKDKSFPIHLAVFGGHISVINLLTTSMCLLNARSQNILHVAVLGADFAMLSYLLNLGVDNKFAKVLINQRDEDGNTPWRLAMKCKVQRLISALERSLKGLKSFPIDGNLYRLIVHGDVNQVCQTISEKGFHLKDLECPEDGCTVLHVAVTIDQPLMIFELLRRDCDMLLYQANNKGDLPIHYAAKAGKFRSLKAIVEWQNSSMGMCKHYNVDGNTALHIALLNNHQKMAKYLYNQCPETAYCLNKDSICPLFLAIKTWGKCDIVNEMINGLEGNTRIQSDLKGAKSVVHVAIFTRRIAILKGLIEKAPGLMDSLDSRGRNPLSYAAHIGYADGVLLLLKRFPHLECKRDEDKDGSFPIHQAAKGGQVKILKLLHPKICLLNIKHQNILHVAAETGRTNVVRFLMSLQEFKELLNTGDENGNTPLHLAVKGAHYKTVNLLTLQKHTDGNSTNVEFFTPRDMIEMYLQASRQKTRSEKKIKLMDLMLTRVKGEKSLLKEDNRDQKEKVTELANISSSSSDHEKSTRERANTFLVVATLIIAVSFTAAFTPPGNHEENSGIPNFVSTSAFKVFMICNHFAFLSSVTSALTIIVGIDVKRFANISLLMGGVHIIIAIMWMSAAFFAGSLDVQLLSLLKPSDTEWVWMIVRRMVEVVTLPLVPVLVFYCGKFKGFSELQILYLLFFCSEQTPNLDFTI